MVSPDVKKQVRSAATQKVQSRCQEGDFRSAGMNNSQAAAAAARRGTGLQDATLPVPRAVSTAPFLKHTVLTPAQKEYLYNIAASHSVTHVRGLITQHYMNVLHRCTPSGLNCGSGGSAGTCADVLGADGGDKSQPEVCLVAKVKNKNTKSKNSDRSSVSFRLPNTSNRREKGSSTKRAKIRLLEEDEEEELDDSLSLLCIGGWDDSCLENIQ